MFSITPRLERLAFSLLTCGLCTGLYWWLIAYFTIPHELAHCPIVINGPPGSNYTAIVGLAPGFNDQFPCLLDAQTPTYRNVFGNERIIGSFDIYAAKFRSQIPPTPRTITIQLECFFVLYQCDVEYTPSTNTRRETHELEPAPPQTHKHPLLAVIVGILTFIVLFVLLFLCTACILAVIMLVCCCTLITSDHTLQTEL